MSQMPYRVLAFVSEASELTIDSLAKALANGLPDGPRVERLDAIARVVDGEWVYVMGHNEEPHVQDEAREVATMFGRDLDEKVALGNCKRRFEGGGAPDPEGKHAETFGHIRRVLEGLPNVILFDADKGKILSNNVTGNA